MSNQKMFDIGDRVRVPASLMYRGTTGTISSQVSTDKDGSWVAVALDRDGSIDFATSDVTPLKEEE